MSGRYTTPPSLLSARVDALSARVEAQRLEAIVSTLRSDALERELARVQEQLERLTVVHAAMAPKVAAPIVAAPVLAAPAAAAPEATPPLTAEPALAPSSAPAPAPAIAAPATPAPAQRPPVHARRIIAASDRLSSATAVDALPPFAFGAPPATFATAFPAPSAVEWEVLQQTLQARFEALTRASYPAAALWGSLEAGSAAAPFPQTFSAPHGGLVPPFFGTTPPPSAMPLPWPAGLGQRPASTFFTWSSPVASTPTPSPAKRPSLGGVFGSFLQPALPSSSTPGWGGGVAAPVPPLFSTPGWGGGGAAPPPPLFRTPQSEGWLRDAATVATSPRARASAVAKHVAAPAPFSFFPAALRERPADVAPAPPAASGLGIFGSSMWGMPSVARAGAPTPAPAPAPAPAATANSSFGVSTWGFGAPALPEPMETPPQAAPALAAVRPGAGIAAAPASPPPPLPRAEIWEAHGLRPPAHILRRERRAQMLGRRLAMRRLGGRRRDQRAEPSSSSASTSSKSR